MGAHFWHGVVVGWLTFVPLTLVAIGVLTWWFKRKGTRDG